jgi:hypothetical protein
MRSNNGQLNQKKNILRLNDLNPNGESIVGSSKDEGDIPEEIRLVNLPEIHPELRKKLSSTVGELLSAKAIDTTSHYMQEFRNDADHRWLTGYKNYKENAFNNVFEGDENSSSWTDWFEDMINRDKLEIQVFMNAPQRAARPLDSEGKPRDTSGIRIEYLHELEPRKIANQVLVVRESITKEILIDLSCIRLENIEAIRFAEVKAKDGEEEALHTAKITRTPTAGGTSTPLRDRTYHDLSVILTNFAIEIVRMHLANDKATRDYLDSYLIELGEEEQKRSVIERLLHEYSAPKELLSELYYRGITQGMVDVKTLATPSSTTSTTMPTATKTKKPVTTSPTTTMGTASSKLVKGGKEIKKKETKVNILKLAQLVLDARYALSLEANHIIVADDNHSRSYYKLIKDKGGFKKIDMGKAKVRVVDLNAPEGDQNAPTNMRERMDLSRAEEDAKEMARQEIEAKERDKNLAKQNLTNTKVQETPKTLATVADDKDDHNIDNFGTAGPFLM